MESISLISSLIFEHVLIYNLSDIIEKFNFNFRMMLSNPSTDQKTKQLLILHGLRFVEKREDLMPFKEAFKFLKNPNLLKFINEQVIVFVLFFKLNFKLNLLLCKSINIIN
ncbi:hypothetical protein M0811_08425 [Anaeramoeba ignava]|uniref:Uncharacterized protein n=1 Tax=Anaeramoeba ignava TaxID=1746090 RepID=A0A9Q0RBI6_ANAIG|nr:hypothetical protein M0811_08425 [Anaeramoeba ignava]